METVYEIPAWGMALLKSMAAAMALLFGFAGFGFYSWFPDEPKYLGYFFLAVSLLAVVATKRLYTWQRVVYFKACQAGMWFPCPLLKQCEQSFLFVPWGRIDGIGIASFISGASGTSKGVSIDIMLTREERNQYFPEQLLNTHTAWTTVGFTDVFLNKSKAVGELRLRKEASSR